MGTRTIQRNRALLDNVQSCVGSLKRLLTKIETVAQDVDKLSFKDGKELEQEFQDEMMGIIHTVEEIYGLDDMLDPDDNSFRDDVSNGAVEQTSTSPKNNVN